MLILWLLDGYLMFKLLDGYLMVIHHSPIHNSHFLDRPTVSDTYGKFDQDLGKHRLCAALGQPAVRVTRDARFVSRGFRSFFRVSQGSNSDWFRSKWGFPIILGTPKTLVGFFHGKCHRSKWMKKKGGTPNYDSGKLQIDPYSVFEDGWLCSL